MPVFELDRAEAQRLLADPSARLRSESEAEFAVRLLEELVEEANGLAQSAIADARALDDLAAKLNESDDWNGGDICELLAKLLLRTGRPICPEPADDA